MPMGRPIQSVTIVGGGTAGWLTAAMLNHRLQWAYGVPGGVPLENELGDIVGHAVAAVEAGRSPRHPQHRPFDGTFGYAYHLDAGLLAEFLREVATARGVEHVLDHVVGTTKNARG